MWKHRNFLGGRYVMSRATGDLLSYFDAKEVEGSPPPPSWNVAPTQAVPIITEKLHDDELDRRLLIARWGLVPSWAKDIKIGSKLINARSETILEKPSFRKAAITRRALIPAEGYLRMAEGRGREEDPVLPLLREGRPPGLRRPIRVLARPVIAGG
jgi:putative SOS response-associated peptidase YedK